MSVCGAEAFLLGFWVQEASRPGRGRKQERGCAEEDEQHGSSWSRRPPHGRTGEGAGGTIPAGLSSAQAHRTEMQWKGDSPK